MRWGAGEAQFVRPVHWVLMLWGGDVVDAEILGQKAGNLTYGHRFMAPKALTIASPASYVGDAAEARQGHGGRRPRAAKPSAPASPPPRSKLDGIAVIDDALLDEVTGLVEWPVPLAGRFDPQFLELPAEVPIATMQEHQRYFPVRDAQGRLMPWFITVSNIESRDPSQVIAGNERVVRPRLTDAAFFYRTDRQQPLSRTDRGAEARDVPDPARLAARQVRARARAGQRDRDRDRRRHRARPTAPPSSASATCSRTWWASSPSCRA